MFGGRVQHAAAAGILGLLVCACYANSLDAGFTLDNRFILLEDPRVRSFSAQNVRAIFTGDYHFPTLVSGLYRPLTTLSYLLNHAVAGGPHDPTPFHVVNLALHWANALLVYALLGMLWGRRSLALAAAALFASHPLATEAVTNLVGRADLLAAFFVLLGLWAHLRSCETAGWSRIPWLVGLGSSAAAGFLCKENAVALVGIVVLFDLVQRRRLAPGSYLAMGVPLLLLWFARISLHADLPTPRPVLLVENPLLAADSWTARWIALGVVARYAWLLVWPARLSCDYSYDQIPLSGPAPLAALALLAALLWIAVRQRNANRSLVFLMGFMPAALLPTSNLLFPIGSIMAERFLYLPLVGFAACAVTLVSAAAARLGERRARALTAAVFSCLVLACGVRTAFRNRDWQDDLRLWSAAIEVVPRSFKAHHALAYALYEAGAPQHRDIDAVIARAESALRILDARPLPRAAEPVGVSLNLGIYYQTRARLAGALDGHDEALSAFERAARVDRAQSEANRRNAVSLGRAARQVPDVGEWRVYEYLGLEAQRLQRYPQAIEAFAYQRHLQPSNAEAYLQLARAQKLSGLLQDAAVTALQARILEPGNQGARALLAEIYGRLDAGGCSLLETAAGRMLDPDCPRVRLDLCAAHLALAGIFSDSTRDPSAAMPWLAAARDHC